MTPGWTNHSKQKIKETISMTTTEAKEEEEVALEEHVPNTGHEEDSNITWIPRVLKTDWMKPRSRLGERAVVRPEAETMAMPFWTRQRKSLRSYMKRHDEASATQQYSIPPREDESIWGAFVSRRRRKRERMSSLASIRVLMVHFLFFYFVVITLFALMLQLFVRLYYDAGKQCVTNYDYSNVSIGGTDNFVVLFGLSWTTFSTVGYGIIGVSNEDGCQALRYFLAIEAFVGVMYSGFTGSLIFASISAVLARAHVTFSNCSCLQYGKGLTGGRVAIRKIDKERVSENEGDSTPGNWPVIEMRLVNDRAGKGASVTDIHIQCIAVIRENIHGKEEPSNDKHDQGILNFQINDGVGSYSGEDTEEEICKEMSVSPNELSYFSSGVIYFNHVLNDNSPLLKDAVRQRIKENRGEWPSDLNDYNKIRACFCENIEYIAVVMKGISSLTAADIFKTVKYEMKDIYVGWTFAELAYMSEDAGANADLADSVRYDLSLVHDIVPQRGGGNEPLGSESSHRTYGLRNGRRQNYGRLLRPSEEAVAMKASRRRRKNLFGKIRRCCRSNDDSEQKSLQYAIPPHKGKRDFLHGIISDGPIISFTLWLYQTSLFNALLAFLLGYFVLIWLFAISVWAVDAECLSGWEDVSGGFVSSFYIPFQVSWCTFSTVGYGGVAPEAGEPCRGLNVILAGEAFIGVIYSSFCGSVIYARISRHKSIANVTFGSAVCLQYGRDGTEEKDAALAKDSSTLRDNLPFPFLEMRLLNEDAQYKNMKGEILNSSMKCFATSFEIKRASDEASDDLTENEGRVAVHHSYDSRSDIQWKRICDELTLLPSRKVVFGKAPWYFRHPLDGSSPLLKPEVRKRIKELDSWPSDLNEHEKIRGCLSPNVDAIHLIIEGTSNQTASSVLKSHKYSPSDIYVGWRFAKLGYIAKTKRGNKSEVKFDPCLLNDIVPQSGGRAEPIHVGGNALDDQDDD